MKVYKKGLAVWIVMLISSMFLLGRIDACATTTDTYDSEDIEYRDIQRVIDSTDIDISFEDEVAHIAKEGSIDFERVWHQVKDKIQDTFLDRKELGIKVISITVITAIFTTFAGIVGSGYISSTSFIVVYMVLISILLNSFKEVYDVAYKFIEVVKTFMEVLCPVYSLASFISNGVSTATVFTQLTYIGIVMIEKFVLSVLLPLVGIYIVIVLVNNISTVSAMGRLASFIKSIINWSTRLMIIFMTSASAIQRIVAPTVDTGRRKLISSGLRAAPFIGRQAEAVHDTVGAATDVIHGSVGGVGMMVLIIMCIAPVISIASYYVVYEISGIAVEVISEKRITSSLAAVSESCKMLMYIVIACVFLFIILIAMMSI